MKPVGQSSTQEKINSEAGFGILLKPHATEKTARAGSYDVYSFIVAKDVNKLQIKDAFSKMYGVKPMNVRIVNMHAELTQFQRIPGVKRAWKKAYIRVPKNSKISVYEGV